MKRQHGLHCPVWATPSSELRQEFEKCKLAVEKCDEKEREIENDVLGSSFQLRAARASSERDQV